MTTPYEEPIDPPAVATFTAEQLQAIVEQALAKERTASKTHIDALAATVNALSASMSGTTPVFVA